MGNLQLCYHGNVHIGGTSVYLLSGEFNLQTAEAKWINMFCQKPDYMQEHRKTLLVMQTGPNY